jgi:hypothetical protein
MNEWTNKRRRMFPEWCQIFLERRGTFPISSLSSVNNLFSQFVVTFWVTRLSLFVTFSTDSWTSGYFVSILGCGLLSTLQVQRDRLQHCGPFRRGVGLTRRGAHLGGKGQAGQCPHPGIARDHVAHRELRRGGLCPQNQNNQSW